MESALQGKRLDRPLPAWLTDAVELYEIVQITGWSLDTIDAAPAVVIDELRAVHRAYEKVKATPQE